MEGLESIPTWLGTAVVGALIATFGFLGKSMFRAWSEARAEKASRLARILRLASLLRASRTTFVVQNNHARRLLSSLEEKHTREIGEESGFERAFSRLYDKFTEDEKELHGIIRSMTVHSLRPINEAVLEWLKEDTTFKTGFIPGAIKNRRQLAEKLLALEAHLILWNAKYEYWIPDEPKHALVYLADEEEHGVGFPTGIESVISDVVLELTAGSSTMPPKTH